MNTMQCPVGYSCSMYPAWGTGEYIVFFGGFALLIVVVFALMRRLFR